MWVEDNTKIKDIEFIYPNIMADGAKDYIKSLHEDLVYKKETLAELRDKCRFMEEKIKELEKEFSFYKKLMKVEYDGYEKEIICNKSNIIISNPDDPSN